METVNKQREVRELETILYELNTVKKNTKVYKQQQNSNVYFLTHVGLLKSEVQRKLDQLQSSGRNEEKIS